MSKGGSGGGSQTVTNQPPQYVQTQAEQNMGTANYLASQPMPQYQGQLDANLTDNQNAGIQQAVNASTAGNGTLGSAANQFDYAASYNPVNSSALGANPVNASATNASNPFNPNLALNSQTINQYMSPYIQASLQPQLQAAQQNLANQQLQTNAQATQDNAFGDARQGVQNALNNYYGNQTMAGIEAQGLNTGYNTALSTAQGQQQLGLNEQGVQQQQQQLGLSEQGVQQNQQQLGLSEQGQQANIGTDLATLANQQQQMGITGANAVENAGQIQQQNQQQQLNTAYQQYLNQVAYPFQMLGVQESAITNNPYSLTSNVQLPGTNPLASGLGAFSSLAGLLGGSGSSGSSTSPFG